jgi:hypothetical protein
MRLQIATGHRHIHAFSFTPFFLHVLSPNFRASAPGIASSMTVPRLYDNPAPSPPSGCLSFSSYFMTKWAAHDDVADVSLCGLDSFTLFFLPTFFPPPSPIHVTLRHPEVLGNVFSSVSLLIQISTAFSFSNTVSIYTQNSSSLLPMYCTSFYHFLGYHPPSRCSAALTVCLSPPS